MNFQELLGDNIGEGAFREVFQHAEDPSLVIKVASNSTGIDCNLTEYEIWNNAIPSRKYLAPVVNCSNNFKYIVMKKTKELTIGNVKDAVIDVYKNYPVWLTDVVGHNMGYLNGNLVVHDYGTISWVAYPDPSLRENIFNILKVIR